MVRVAKRAWDVLRKPLRMLTQADHVLNAGRSRHRAQIRSLTEAKMTRNLRMRSRNARKQTQGTYCRAETQTLASFLLLAMVSNKVAIGVRPLV
eukprot:737238-Pleurochrysis_carterae.AAC.1